MGLLGVSSDGTVMWWLLVVLLMVDQWVVIGNFWVDRWVVLGYVGIVVCCYG